MAARSTAAAPRPAARRRSRAPQNPCIRANNLSTGYAVEFNASDGLITVAKGGDTAKPFTTNATGVATGLNADRVDGKHAEDIANDAVAASRALKTFAQVAANGTAGRRAAWRPTA